MAKNSTLHDDIPRVWFLIKECKGKDNAMTSSSIQGLHGNYYGDSISDYRVRAAISQMVRDGKMIATCPQGFFLIMTREEWQHELDTLTSRAEAIHARSDALYTKGRALAW